MKDETTSKTGRGRKVSMEYFKDFDTIKSVGDKFIVKVDPNRYNTKYIQMRLINQARSYQKFHKIEFKISTRIRENEITVFLMNRL